MKTKDNLPKRFYYQLNSKSPMENYIENRKDLIESCIKRKKDNNKQSKEYKSYEKFLEKSIVKEIHIQLDKLFSKI